MGKDLASGYILISQLRQYKNQEEPYNASYVPGYDIPNTWWNTIEPEPDYLQVLALKLLAIVPNSASCERNFSLLSWLTGNKRLQLDVQNLESIAKMCSFFNANAKKELPYFSAKMTEEQILQILNETNTQILEEEDFDQEELLQSIDRPSSNTRSATANKNLFLEASIELNSQVFDSELDYIFDNDDDDDESLIELEDFEEILNDKESENNEGVGIFDWDPNNLVNDDDD